MPKTTIALRKIVKGPICQTTLPTRVRNYLETLSESLRDHVGPGEGRFLYGFEMIPIKKCPPLLPLSS
jgi:hypothetical protein